MEYEKLLDQLISLHPENAEEIMSTFQRRGDFSGSSSADIYNIILLKEMSKLFSQTIHFDKELIASKHGIVTCEEHVANEEVSDCIDFDFLKFNLI